MICCCWWNKIAGIWKMMPKMNFSNSYKWSGPSWKPGISINDAGFLEYGLSSNGRIPPYSAHQSLFAEENIFAFIIPSFPVFSSVPSPPSVVQLYLISRTSKFFLVCLHSSWPGWTGLINVCPKVRPRLFVLPHHFMIY